MHLSFIFFEKIMQFDLLKYLIYLKNLNKIHTKMDWLIVAGLGARSKTIHNRHSKYVLPAGLTGMKARNLEFQWKTMVCWIGKELSWNMVTYYYKEQQNNWVWNHLNFKSCLQRVYLEVIQKQ